MDGFNAGQAFESGLRKIVDFLPQLLAAILILIVGYIVAKILEKLTRTVLRKIRFERAVTSSAAGKYIAHVIESPSRFVGRVAYWIVMLGAISLAVSALNLPLLNNFVSAIYGYLPNVIAAIIIFLVASAISAGVDAFVLRILGKGSPVARILMVAIPAITMSIAIFMILNQLGIARDIVNITYAAIMFALSLGSALAFGLGGRDVAADLLGRAVDAARSQSDTVKAEARRAAANTRSEVENVKRSAR